MSVFIGNIVPASGLLQNIKRHSGIQDWTLYLQDCQKFGLVLVPLVPDVACVKDMFYVKYTW